MLLHRSTFSNRNIWSNVKRSNFSSRLRLHFAMTLSYLAWLPGRSRRHRRLLKLLVVILSSSIISYFAFSSFKKNNVILTCECGGYFTDVEVQKTSDTREVQLTVKNYSRGNDTRKVQQSTVPVKNLPLSFKNTSVVLTSNSGGNFTDEVQKPTAPREAEGRKGGLAVSIWRDLWDLSSFLGNVQYFIVSRKKWNETR